LAKHKEQASMKSTRAQELAKTQMNTSESEECDSETFEAEVRKGINSFGM
jgi:hypothetical protein